jgi:hypothetical protein
MSNPLGEFVVAAANIKEGGRWAAINERIACLAKNPGKGNEWWVQLLGALCFEVFAEYRRLQDARAKHTDPPLLAWRARNLLELSVWSTYFASSHENARCLYLEAGRDANDLLATFNRWDQSADWLATIAEAKSGLSRRAASEGIGNLEEGFMRVASAASQSGLRDMFTVANKMLSKFAHPTAMRILGTVKQEQESLQRDIFYGHGCFFFVGAFSALERAALETGSHSR